MTSCLLSLLFFFFSSLPSAATAAQPAGCKIRITDRGLEMLKSETLKFVEEELSNITIPEMKGKDGRFQYTITDVKIMELNLTHADLQFYPQVGLLFDVQNSSISLSFYRRVLYWFFYDTGNINASADGVNINTVLNLIRDDEGRLKINNITCDASIAHMRAQFSGTLGRVYDFLSTFLTSGMRFLLSQQVCLTRPTVTRLSVTRLSLIRRCVTHPSLTCLSLSHLSLTRHPLTRVLLTRLSHPSLSDPPPCYPSPSDPSVPQICPALEHAALVHVNSMLETIPVRTEVDGYIGIDYSLINNPVVTSRGLDMNFRGMFFELSNQNETLVNTAVDPVITEYERMVYLALSEYFFDSGLLAYYRAGIFEMDIVNEKMPKDLEMLLRTTYSVAIMVQNPGLMDAPISLHLAVNVPPKTTIKTSGATVAMKATVKVMLLPAGRPPFQLSSMTMETKFNAKVSMKGKRLAVHLDLRRFKIFSNKSALESLALIPLQGPLKTMLQMSVVPFINNWTKRGVQIPLADGMDFIEEVVEYHNGFIVIGANLHFIKGLREMVAGSETD
ncbi:phospholipid transfer protein isoform X1 [Antennarius striatus]|uniref:phospholipid transfer protein isoform X1 n=1 Tax=Antennarius striatus TaxID=241820 RepID=UPI0035B403EE